jgi:hypothetical protein
MVDFNFTPSQYYSRTPVVNQTGAAIPGFASSLPYSKNYGVATFQGYNPYAPVPGTIGYSLPAQTYYNYGINNQSFYGTQTLKTALVNTAVTTGVDAILNNLLGDPNNPASNRLNGIPAGASPTLLQPVSGNSNTAFMNEEEDRVIISDQTGYFIGQSNIYAPLSNFRGVLFPYTPTIQVSHKASYEMQSLVHTNYVTPMYQHSAVDNIGIQAQFTANYPAEAEYMVAMMHFFRAVTKMFYGQDSIAGTPPPVLYLDAYGPYTFDHVPVVVTSFDYSMPADVDYISCEVAGYKQKIPTIMNISLSMIPTYSRDKISNEFGLQKFVSGGLIQQGNQGGYL